MPCSGMGGVLDGMGVSAVCWNEWSPGGNRMGHPHSIPFTTPPTPEHCIPPTSPFHSLQDSTHSRALHSPSFHSTHIPFPLGLHPLHSTAFHSLQDSTHYREHCCCRTRRYKSCHTPICLVGWSLASRLLPLPSPITCPLTSPTLGPH